MGKFECSIMDLVHLKMFVTAPAIAEERFGFGLGLGLELVQIPRFSNAKRIEMEGKKEEANCSIMIINTQ